MNALRRLLINLAEAGRTGALRIDGPPGGVLYLVSGRLTYAESPACPGIGERLVACGRLSEAAWRSAYESGVDTRSVGRALLRDGHLGHHELACRVVAAITAATHELLQCDAPVRFVPGERHWFGTVAQVELGGLVHETAKRLLNCPAPHRPRAVSRARRPARATK